MAGVGHRRVTVASGHQRISSGQKQKSSLTMGERIAEPSRSGSERVGQGRGWLRGRYKLDLKRDTRHAPAITTTVNDISPLARRAPSNLIALGQDAGTVGRPGGVGNSGRLQNDGTGRECTASGTPFTGPIIRRARDRIFCLHGERPRRYTTRRIRVGDSRSRRRRLQGKRRDTVYVDGDSTRATGATVSSNVSPATGDFGSLLPR